jgi:cell wall-associated NlpC family hydrolase
VQNRFYFTGSFSNIYKKSSKFSEVTSQILYGEKFKILSKNKNWIKIKSNFDNYTGYIQNKNFSKEFNANYKVSSLKANISNKFNKKTKIFLPFGSKVDLINENKNHIEFEKNKWLKKSDLKKIDHKEINFNKIFKLFLKTKYVWGGKTYRGIDCSALLQIFYYYNNKFFPRDTKDQIKYLKGNLKRNYQKGDIIFWKGHVAMCLNSKQLIHAYGPEKKVLIMPILKTIKRIENTAKLKVKKIAKIKI